jgi:hypothetical protein
MRGKWIVARYEFTAPAGSREAQMEIARQVIEEIDMDPPSICSLCGRELWGGLARQYEIAGTWDNFGPDDAREPCSPRYLSGCRQPHGIADWEM